MSYVFDNADFFTDDIMDFSKSLLNRRISALLDILYFFAMIDHSFRRCISGIIWGGEKMGAQTEISRLIEKSGIPLIEISRATAFNYELLRRSVRGIRKMTADEYVILCKYMASKGISI